MPRFSCPHTACLTPSISLHTSALSPHTSALIHQPSYVTYLSRGIPDLKGNIRDYATINELICLSNMENINAVLINAGVPQGERLVKLNQIAIQQMQVLEGNEGRNLLK